MCSPRPRLNPPCVRPAVAEDVLGGCTAFILALRMATTDGDEATSASDGTIDDALAEGGAAVATAWTVFINEWRARPSCQLETLLFVAVGTGAGPGSDRAAGALEAWSSEAWPVEFVLFHEEGPHDHGARDKEGLPRVVEALTCHQWPDMRRGPPAPRTTATPTHAAAPRGADADLAEARALLARARRPLVRALLRESVSTLASASTGSEEVVDVDSLIAQAKRPRLLALLRGLRAELLAKPSAPSVVDRRVDAEGDREADRRLAALLDGPHEGASVGRGYDDDDDDKDGTKGIDELVQQMTALRRDGQALGDDERRSRAADLALAAARLCGVDLDSDAESEGIADAPAPV